MPLREHARDYFKQPRRKIFSDWLIVGVLILGGEYLGGLLSELNAWINIRYHIYQFLQELNPRPLLPRYTVLVVINDEEYWKGELARRVPIKRDYLAKLLKKLAEANPAVIAIDFDLRSPIVDNNSMIEHDAYKNETNEFLEAVKEVSCKIPVVLPWTIRFDEDQKDYVETNKIKEVSCKIPVVSRIIRCVQKHYLLEPAIFDEFDFKDNTNVQKGYISLPYDKRLLPLSLKTKNAGDIDSFSTAIVRAFNKEALKDLDDHYSQPFGDYTLRYGSYIRWENFKNYIFDTGAILKGTIPKQKLVNKIVIVGGTWHKLAYNRGDLIDTHLTPVGEEQGVHMHANYVEAILDSRTSKPWGENTVKFIGVFAAIIVAIVLRLDMRPLLIVILICLVLVIFSYFSLQNLGKFFDFFIPILLIVSHFAYERIHDWRKKVIEWNKKQQATAPVVINDEEY